MKEVLNIAHKAQSAVHMIGDHGIGKTEIVKQFAESQGYHCEVLQLTVMDTGDLIGIPETIEKDGERVTAWAKPIWLQRVNQANKEGKHVVVFLDELGRASVDIRQASLQMVLEGKIQEHSLGELDNLKSLIVVADNPADDYDSAEFDGALEDTIVDFNFEFHSSSSEYLSKAIRDMFKYVPVNFTKGKFRITQNDMPLYLYTYSNGKITFYGGDFEMVRGVIKQVTVEYGHEIKRIEEKEKRGEPVLILFSESKRLPSGMTSKFLSKFLSMDNLKLFNVDIFEGSDYAKAIVADFHVGGTLVIKLYSYGMLLTLLNGSCANSVKRIESFLRRSYDPYIEVLVDEEEIIGKLEAFESGEEGIS